MTVVTTPDLKIAERSSLHDAMTWPAPAQPGAVHEADIPIASSHALMFDRNSRELTGANWREHFAALAYRAGAALSSVWGYRGFAAASSVVRRLVPEREITVRLATDTLFSFPFGDGYWSLLLNPDYRYERDIERFFRGIADAEYTLIDCGANFGYWSVQVTGAAFGAQRALAIEPSSTNFAHLSRNAALNGNRFLCLQRAIGAQAGTARLSGHKHEALSIAGPAGDAGEDVTVVTLDDLIPLGLVAADGCHVIKLDVEGVELEALKGAGRLLSSDCVVICEEHGSDLHHTVSRHLIDKTPLKVFCFDPSTGRFEYLDDVSALDRIKVFANFGYNVLATASPMWEARIRSIRA